MKTSGSMVGGRLRPEAQPALANYLVRFVDAFTAEGVPIFALTLQNEPGFEPRNYPGMKLDPGARAPSSDVTSARRSHNAPRRR